jgi:hypothetical protein
MMGDGMTAMKHPTLDRLVAYVKRMQVLVIIDAALATPQEE